MCFLHGKIWNLFSWLCANALVRGNTFLLKTPFTQRIYLVWKCPDTALNADSFDAGCLAVTGRDCCVAFWRFSALV